ncbi:MAG: hypothetical protein ACKVOH_01435 [Chlamydiales bacterium]
MSEKKVLQLLVRKRGFFEAILDLSKEEETLSLSQYISILEQKKVLLSCIDEIDQELLSFKASFHNLSQTITEEIDKTRRVVLEILHLDKENERKRKKQLRDISHEK